MPVTMVAVYVSLQDFAAPLIKIYSQGVCSLLRYDTYVVVSHIGPTKVLSVGVPQRSEAAEQEHITHIVEVLMAFRGFV